MSNLNEVRKKLYKPSGYAIIPVIHIDTPLPFPDWEIEEDDGDGNLVGTGEYYTPNSLSKALGGRTLELVPWIDDRFVLMRYGMDWDTINDWDDFMEATGLKHARKTSKKGKKAWKKAKEVDYTDLDGTEFFFIPPYMIDDIPKKVVIIDELPG